MRNNKNKTFHYLFISGVIFTILISFNHCGKVPSPPSEPSYQTSPFNVPNNTGLTEVESEEVQVGVKNFEEINKTMSTLTGVSESLVNNIYGTLKLQLPTDNNIKAFQTINQLAVIKLAAEYCNKAVDNSTTRLQLWPDTPWSLGPSTAFNTTNSQYFINTTLKKFWTITDTDLINYSYDIIELEDLLSELLVGANLSSSSETRKVAKGLCTAVLASARVSIL